MDPDQHLDALVAPLRADVASGASAAIGRMAAGILRRATIRLQAGSLEEYRWAQGRGVRQGARRPTGHGTVGGARVRRAGRRGGLSRPRAGSLRRRTHLPEAFRSGLALREEAVAARAAALLPAGGTVLTISSSSTVESIPRSGGTGVGHHRGHRVRGTNAPGTRRASGEHRAAWRPPRVGRVPTTSYSGFQELTLATSTAPSVPRRSTTLCRP